MVRKFSVHFLQLWPTGHLNDYQTTKDRATVVSAKVVDKYGNGEKNPL